MEKLAGKVPILGICLGHQIIGHVFGAEVEKGERPMHGKVSTIETNQKGLFGGLPKTYEVTVLTQYGHELLENFVKISKEWWGAHENKGL